MSLQAMGKVPPYQDISHFRAPYKNAIFAGFGAITAGTSAPTGGSGDVGMYVVDMGRAGIWYTTSLDATRRHVPQHGSPFDSIKAVAIQLAHALGRDVVVYRTGAQGAVVGGEIFKAFAHGVISHLQGLGDDPAACVAPKWTYNEATGQCHCAPGYVPTLDGADCIPLVDPNAPQVPPAGGLTVWTLTDPVTGATLGVPAGAPGAAPAPAPAACTGYQVGSTCVPKWALWVGGGLAALLVIDMVL